MKTPRESDKQWRERRKKEGWKGYAIFGPPQLLEAVKNFMREWKHNNYDQHYKPITK